MLSQIKQRILDSEPTQLLINAIRSNKNCDVHVRGVAGSLASFVISILQENYNRQFFCVFPDIEQAEILYEEISELIPNIKIRFFEHIGRHAFTDVGAAPSLIARRLEAIDTALIETKSVIVCTAQSLIEKIPRPEDVRNSQIIIKRNKEIDFNKTVIGLTDLGFTRERMVSQKGEFSVRGGILDVFPYISETPVRIEFFDNIIESIRGFDIESQRSTDSFEYVKILSPFAAEINCSSTQTHNLSKKGFGNLFHYLHTDGILFFFDFIRIKKEITNFVEQLKTYTALVDDENEKKHIDSFYYSWSEIEKQILGKKKVFFDALIEQHEAMDIIHFKSSSRSQLGGNFKRLFSEIEQDRIYFKIHKPEHSSLIVFCCENNSQKKRLENFFDEEGLNGDNFFLLTLRLFKGFRDYYGNLSVYTSYEFYGKALPTKARMTSGSAIPQKHLSSIIKGDFVVHSEHGIGRFLGLEKIVVWGKERESIKIEYRDKEILYVPLDQMDKVKKFSSRDGFHPTLNKLGTKGWTNLKRKTKKRVRDIAEDLINLYAKRKAEKGFSFATESFYQDELEASFFYDETPDQTKAIQDIMRDMENERPMDRLVCGDVGYGKTEVAIRAALKAASENKQVAVLVPTTILAQQQYSTFRDRLGQFPVQVEMLSRFRSPENQKEIIKKTKEGRIDVLIGTHRMLSKDVEFKDLGLMIVDEEQKFGVVHKEKLKFLTSGIDVLTLTATPIPRTLHLALLGGRDISLISTPPQHRHPVVTEVTYFDKKLIRDAMLGEVARGGQVFFVHNRVQSIHAMTALLKNLVPEISFCVAHGQMRGGELEKTMLYFLEGKYHCLVSTMIIESGMDIPNVNTLIVNRADRFGLSQLYQLRGRVGRSFQQAYAYFLIPPLRKISREAIKRLQTIQEFTHLGSGYSIALRDLEIRGAGNFLGAEQSGFMDALGFDLYCQIVDEAVKELKSEKLGISDSQIKQPVEPAIQIDCNAFIPEEYMDNESDRIDIYSRLVSSVDIDQVNEIKGEIRDRFGPLPIETMNLLDYVVIKIIARKVGITQIQIKDNMMKVLFDKSVIPSTEQFRNWVGKIVSKASSSINFVQRNDEFWIKVKLSQSGNKLSEVKIILQTWL